MYDEHARNTSPQYETGQPEYVAAEALATLHAAYEHYAEQSKSLLRLALTEGPETAVLPADLGNKHYRVNEAEVASRRAFLRDRLGGIVLDIGAGPGHELADSVAEGSRVVYLDSQSSTDQDHVQGDARNAPFRNQAFTGIYSRNCLGTGEKSDTKAIISEARRMLAPGGAMVFATSYSTMENTSKSVLDTLEALSEDGIDIADPTQCEIAILSTTIEHISSTYKDGPEQGKPVSLTYPEVLLTVRPQS